MSAGRLEFPAMVNALFTMSMYRDGMKPGFLIAVKSLICTLTMLIGIGVFAQDKAYAQTADVDWQDAGIGSLTPFPSGTTVTGSDGTTATVTWQTQTNGGTFVPAFGGDFVSYFDGTIGGVVAPMLFSFDNGSYDPNDRIVVTIDLSRPVYDLNFTIADLDNGNFQDAMEVYYAADSSSGFINAATDTSLWTAGSGIERTNNGTFNGWRGAANSGNDQTLGNLSFDFGATRVQRIQIVYFSNNNVTGDPGAQFSVLSDLTFMEISADLSLTKQLLGSAPSTGGFATWRLTVINATDSETTAGGIVVSETLPTGFNFSSASGDGSFNSATGEWTVGSLAPGQSASIDIAGEVTAAAGTTITNVAEIIASDVPDPDSTVNNGASSEDDYASSSFTVQTASSGTPPTLPCPVGETTFDWDTVSWTPGSLSNSYALSTYGDIEFDIVSDANFVARFGGDIPLLTTAISGGLSPAELGLAFNMNNSNTSQQAVTTITLPRVFTGAQFAVFDIDRSGTFQDRVSVYGFLNGVRVNAILTNGLANTVSGTSLLGSAGAGDSTANGTGVFTFLDPVDTIVIEYGSGTDAPADPTNQSIAIHDFSFCIPYDPNISVSKVSSVIADPVNGVTNPKAIPGATVEYLITVTNSGQGTAYADSVVIWDDGPADAKFCLITRTGGPVIFNDGSGSSGLSYTFSSLGSGTDDIEFSNDNGSTFTYTPSADGDGCDTAVTDFRINPKGIFAASSSFTLTVRFVVE